MNKIFRSLVLTATGLLLGIHTLHAATYYVGGPSDPFSTIQAGLDVARAGDTVSIRGALSGTGRVYDETPVFRSSGTSGFPITIQNYPGEKVIIRHSGTIILNKDFITISGTPRGTDYGLVLHHNSTIGNGMNLTGDNVIIEGTEHYKHETLQNGPGHGIMIQEAINVEIRNNSIHNFGRQTNDGWDHCITTDRSNPSFGIQNLKILNNWLYNCSGDGIQIFRICSGRYGTSDCTTAIDPALVVSRDVLIQGNTFYSTLGDWSENAIDIKQGNGITIRGNHMYGFKHPSGAGASQTMSVQKDPTNFLFESNIIHDCDSGPDWHTEYGLSMSNVIVRNNLIYDIGTSNPPYTSWGLKFDMEESGETFTGAQVYNNTIVNTKLPIMLRSTAGSSGNIVLRNNIIHRGTRTETIGSGWTITVSNNGWFNASRVSSLIGSGDVTGTDPGFVDETIKDFHLASNSVCIDRGVDVGLPYNGVAPDLGTFEFGTAQPAVCGNNVGESGEACDGTDLGGQTCQSRGFDFGTITCNSDCLGFNTTQCQNDTTPPVISNVQATNIGSSQATITWTTNESADSQVEYGLSASYGNSTTLNPTLVTSHSQTLSGLSAETLYHFRVKSKDARGNLATSGDFTFTTPTPPDTTPPSVAITSPVNGATVSSPFTVVGTASDNVGLARVEVQVDGGSPQTASGTTNWSLSLNLANGSPSILARAVDTSNNTSTHTISVTVSNSTSPPSGFPVNHQGTPPEEATVILQVSKPANATGATLTMRVYDPDFPDEGNLYINGNGPVALFGSLGTTGNDGLILTLNYATTAWWWLDGANSLRFVHLRTQGYRVDSASVTFSTPGPDTTPPSVTITSPADGSSVGVNTNVTVAGSDNRLVTRVELWSNGALSDTQVFNPGVPAFNFNFKWQAQSYGRNVLEARAYDNSGNIGYSPLITVRVLRSKKPGLVLLRISSPQAPEGIVTNQDEAQPRVLMVSPRSGNNQELLFSDEVREARVLSVSGKVLAEVARSGSAP
ncbi:MAG: right-handed parallel beta-helix repeat-containing protein, partial [Elusimicrobia bacterium]|nr:right-handed parallel beta-helix repeat-containing protein [Elusimicrobiota bacterium]